MIKKKKKITVLVISGLSAILIILSIAMYSISIKNLLIFGNEAIDIDAKNNNIISSELFLELIKKTANTWSFAFDETADYVTYLSHTVRNTLTAENRTDKNIDHKISFERYLNRDFFVDTAQKKFNLYYWGNHEKVPQDIIKQIGSLLNISYMFKFAYEINPEEFISIWLYSYNKFVFSYPKNNKYYKNILTRSVYDNFFPPTTFSLKNEYPHKIPPVEITQPYKDISEQVCISVKTPIYDIKNNYIATLGIDIDFNYIKKRMLNNDLFSSNSDSIKRNFMKGFFFMLDSHGNIIAFPEQNADLFSLPKDFLNFQDYLKSNTVKFKDSKNKKIRELAEEMTHHTSNVKTINLKNNKYIIAYSKIKKNNWILGCIVDQESLLSSTIKTKKKIQNTEDKLIKANIYLTIVFFLLSLVTLYILFRIFFLTPIKKMRKEINSMKENDFKIDLKENGAAEIADLSASFNYLSKEIRKYMINLKKEITTRQAVETEIKIAANIQKSTLPNINSINNDGYYYIFARLDPAKNISGDFYDFFDLKNNRLALLIADVSGEGIHASFFMAMSKALIKNYSLIMQDKTPAEILKKVNKSLCLDNKSQIYVSVFLAFYDLKNGSLIYANAGQSAAVKIDNKKIEHFADFKNIPLGIFDHAAFDSGQMQININETLLLYTTGITEEQTSNRKFDKKKLTELINENKDLSPDILCNTIACTVENLDAENRIDDITLIALKRCK